MKTSCRNLFLLFIISFAVIIVFQSCKEDSNPVTQVPDTSYEMKVTFAPIEVKSTDGKVNLMYSIETSNFEKEGYILKDFQVLNSSNGNMLCTINDTNKYLVILKPYTGAIPQNLFYYPLSNAHSTYCFLVGLALDPAQVPQKIKHKLVLLKGNEEKTIEGAETSVSKMEPLVFAAPLKGERFMSANATTLLNNHHPKLSVLYKGITTIPERYCIDWNKVDATGNASHGDESICENWYVFGQDVYSVATGEVVSVTDGMPDQSPVGTKSNDLTMFNGTGNSVTLAVAGGYFTYGHMIKNSIMVKTGQVVTEGQLIGKVGNSGNSDAPHLHIGFHTDFPYYISEGLPYYIDSFEKIGSVGETNNLIWLTNPQQNTNKMVENYGIYNLK
ncbi:MAG: M23 family metallopeptidase [Ignavibacteriaceae bacterium]|nr:M23 family metallopeptidase [Ignavibacteriaceae bacterium]